MNDLVRPSSGRLLAGVCAALAPRFGTRARVWSGCCSFSPACCPDRRWWPTSYCGRSFQPRAAAGRAEPDARPRDAPGRSGRAWGRLRTVPGARACPGQQPMSRPAVAACGSSTAPVVEQEQPVEPAVPVAGLVEVPDAGTARWRRRAWARSVVRATAV